MWRCPYSCTMESNMFREVELSYAFMSPLGLCQLFPNTPCGLGDLSTHLAMNACILTHEMATMSWCGINNFPKPIFVAQNNLNANTYHKSLYFHRQKKTSFLLSTSLKLSFMLVLNSRSTLPFTQMVMLMKYTNKEANLYDQCANKDLKYANTNWCKH